jgi:hypothetical protein
MTVQHPHHPSNQPAIGASRLSRRAAIARLAALGLSVPTLSTLVARNALAAPGSATPGASPKGLVYKGIDYDVGTAYVPGTTTRPASHRAFLRQEIEAIRDQLHCTSVGIYGSDADRLIEGATAALEAGLHVRLQPRFIDANADEILSRLSALARAAEELSAGRPELVLDVGVEFTLFADGIVPGTTFQERIAGLLAAIDQLPVFNQRLNELLARAVAVARADFSGPLTYGSGTWEEVDWSGFDFVGVDLYRDATNWAGYLDTLRAYGRHGKPLLVTEFGCCCYEGAADRGGGGYDIVDWSKPVPELNGDYVRDESVQADYIAELLDLYEREGVHGAFVYEFIQPESPHDPDPRYDLDMASYAVVKVYPPDSDKPYETTGYWEPKEAFGAIAGRFGAT